MRATGIFSPYTSLPSPPAPLPKGEGEFFQDDCGVLPTETEGINIRAISVADTSDISAVRAGDTCPSARKDATAQKEKDIVDTAVAAGSFKTLAAALDAGGCPGFRLNFPFRIHGNIS